MLLSQKDVTIKGAETQSSAPFSDFIGAAPPRVIAEASYNKRRLSFVQ